VLAQYFRYLLKYFRYLLKYFRYLLNLLKLPCIDNSIKLKIMFMGWIAWSKGIFEMVSPKGYKALTESSSVG